MWIAAIALSVLVALVFVANGAAKLLGHPRMIEASAHLGYSVRAFRIIGLLEGFGALGILLAPLCVPLSVSAATGLVLLSLGSACSWVCTTGRRSRWPPDRRGVTAGSRGSGHDGGRTRASTP